MTRAAVIDQRVGFFHRVFKVFGAVQSQNGRQFFVRERFCGRRVFDFANQNLCFFGNFDSRHFRDFISGLTDNRGVYAARGQQNGGDFFAFLFIQNVCAAEFKFLADGFVHFVNRDNGLFGRANHAVVERFAQQNRGNSHLNVGSFVNDRGRIAGTDAQSGLARRISGFDHAGTARRQNDVNLGVFHQHIGQFDGRFVNPADDSFRSAGFDCGFQAQLGGGDGAFLGAGMR